MTPAGVHWAAHAGQTLVDVALPRNACVRNASGTQRVGVSEDLVERGFDNLIKLDIAALEATDAIIGLALRPSIPIGRRSRLLMRLFR